MADVRIIHPSIDNWHDTVVVRGILDNETLVNLRTDFYQRELLPSASRKFIREALEKGDRLPDVVLGMRGDSFGMIGKDVLLKDDVFIIDGQQRIKTILEMVPKTKSPPRLGAVIHLNTSVGWERDLFQKLNQYQQKVSPNILLRNNKEDHPLVATLYGLTNSDRQFVLYDRACWSQNMRRNHLVTASTLLMTSMNLHSHLAPTLSQGIARQVPSSDRLVRVAGLPVLRANIKTFWNLIDECWGIRRIHIKGGAPYMATGFLYVLAKFLSDHPAFWAGNRLEVDYLLRRKLAKFPITDPEIVRLTAAAGAARVTLYIHLVNHLNSGKRTKRLVARDTVITLHPEADEAEAA